MCNYIRLLYLKSINFGCALCFLRYSQTSEDCRNLAKNIAEASQENRFWQRKLWGKTAMAKKIIYFLAIDC